MKRSAPGFVRILLGTALCALLLATTLLIFSALRTKTLARNHPSAPPSQAHTEARADNALENAPFLLEVTNSAIGAQNYVSFVVSFKNTNANERVFTCGRMFEAASFESIAWRSTGYDIIVTLKNGQTVEYVFDGNNNWQQTD